MALVLEGSKYFLTPKLANNNINGLLSSEDKEKINSIPSINTLITTDNINGQIKDFITMNKVINLFGDINEENVVFTITKDENENNNITGEGTLKIKEDNKIELKFSVPFDKIKGKDGTNGKPGESPEISEKVNFSYGEEGVTKASASFSPLGDDGKYQLNLNFPDLKGESGASGKSCSINDVNVTMINENDKASGTVVRVPSENSENSYNIELSIPRGKTGPRGYPGAKGDTGGITNLKISKDNIGGNTIQNIEYTGDNDSNKFILSTHNSPVLSETISKKKYSILYKSDDEDNLTYTTLDPPESSDDIKILCYNENNSSKLGYASKSDLNIPQIELKKENENDNDDNDYYIKLKNIIILE